MVRTGCWERNLKSYFIQRNRFICILKDFFTPHEYIGQKERIPNRMEERLLKTGLFVALGIGIHNFPEGMATFYSFLYNPGVGIAIALAIAIHNIPEGIAVSAPVYNATGSRAKAFIYSFLSGVTEPIGALITALFLLPFLSGIILAYILSAIGGIMVFISVDELIPVSSSYGYVHLPIISFLFGVVAMIGSLALI